MNNVLEGGSILLWWNNKWNGKNGLVIFDELLVRICFDRSWKIFFFIFISLILWVYFLLYKTQKVVHSNLVSFEKHEEIIVVILFQQLLYLTFLEYFILTTKGLNSNQIEIRIDFYI